MFSTEIRYAVIRYMLNELGDEAANVGLVVVANDPVCAVARFMPDPTLKSRGDAKVNRDSVIRFAKLVEEELAKVPTRTGEGDLCTRAFERLSDIGGNLVRLSAPRSVLTNDVEAEIETLYKQLITPSIERPRRELAQRDPLGGLRREARGTIRRSLRQALSAPSRKAFKSGHEVRGRVHTSIFDAALVTKSGRQVREHLFHHVLILPDAEESFNQAASLLWKWHDVQARNGRDRELTAVLFSRQGTRREGVEEAKAVLRKDKVEVAEISQIPRLATKLEPQLELEEA